MLSINENGYRETALEEGIPVFRIGSSFTG